MSQAEIQEMKNKLYDKIAAINDETTLQMLNEAVTEYTAVEHEDILDELTPEQFARLQESIKQVENGQVTPHSEVMKMARGWLSK